jgi:hypothetical protein
MSAQPFVLRPDQHEPVLNVVGTQVTVLASNAATQSYGITLQQGGIKAPRPFERDSVIIVLCLPRHWGCDRL